MIGMTFTVVHSTPVWLPQTHTWLYNQISFLTDDILAYVVCERTENLDKFPLPNVRTLSEESLWRRTFDRGLRKLSLRHHLGFVVRQCQDTGSQILHSHFGHRAWANLNAARQAQVKHCATFYGFDVNFLPKRDPRWRGRYHELFDKVDMVFCEGPFMANAICNLGCPSEKVKVHHLGVDLSKIQYKPRQWSPGTPLRFLIAASFTEKKGIPYALEALGRLQSNTEIDITIIGDANESPRRQVEKKRIMDTVEKNNLSPRIRWLGYQPYSVLLEEAYRSHIFISPSVTASDGDTEGGAPVTLIEMAASGLPIVSTLHCDIPEVVRTGTTGLLAEERDVAGLVSHLLWLVENPEHWKIMTDKAREHIELNYDAVRQGAKMSNHYRNLIDRGYK